MFSVMQSLINKALHLDPRSVNRLSALQNKTLQIIIDTPYTINSTVHFTEQGILLENALLELPDVTLKGPLSAFLCLAFSKNVHRALRLGLTIAGDVLQAEEMQSLFLSLNIEWEESLSRITNDTFSAQVGNFARLASKKQKEWWRSLSYSIAEYLQEEKRILVGKEEINDFMNDVDRLREKTERLNLRLMLLEQI